MNTWNAPSFTPLGSNLIVLMGSALLLCTFFLVRRTSVTTVWHGRVTQMLLCLPQSMHVSGHASSVPVDQLTSKPFHDSISRHCYLLPYGSACSCWFIPMLPCSPLSVAAKKEQSSVESLETELKQDAPVLGNMCAFAQAGSWHNECRNLTVACMCNLLLVHNMSHTLVTHPLSMGSRCVARIFVNSGFQQSRIELQLQHLFWAIQRQHQHSAY